MGNSIQGWISQARASGLTDSEIRTQLKASGWQDVQIDAYLGGGTSAASSTVVGVSQQALTTSGDAIGESIFKRAFQATKQAFLQYLVIGVLGAIFAVVVGYACVALLIGSGASVVAYVIGFFVTILVMVFVFLVIQYSAVVIISYKTTSIGQAISLTMKKVIPYSLAGVLAYFVIAGGTYLFFIPGVLMALAFTLLPFVVAYENLSGFAAMKRCYAIAKGHRGQILWALLVLFLVYLGVFVLLFLLLSVITAGAGAVQSDAGNFISGVWLILTLVVLGLFYIFWPLFQTSYIYVLYTDIAACQQIADIQTEHRGKKLMIGYIVVFFLFIIFSFGLTSFLPSNLSSTTDDLQRMSAVSTTYYDILEYTSATNGLYPASLDELLQDPNTYSITQEDADLLTYTTSADGSGFLLCTTLKNPREVMAQTNTVGGGYYSTKQNLKDYCMSELGMVDKNRNKVTSDFGTLD